MTALIWLPEAVDDLERLIGFLVQKSPRAANRVAGLILNSAELIQEHPEIGKQMADDSNRRELFLPFGSSAYVLRYMIDDEDVVVIRTWHCREYR